MTGPQRADSTGNAKQTPVDVAPEKQPGKRRPPAQNAAGAKGVGASVPVKPVRPGARASGGGTAVEKVRSSAVAPAKRNKPPAPKPAPVVSLDTSRHASVARARPMRRHYFLVVSFFAMVLLPALIVIGYLYFLASDRYASQAAFSVHKEDSSGAMEMLGGLPALGVTSGMTPDADILYQFIQSQRMVEMVDAKLDLRAILGATYASDPVFSLNPSASLEDLVKYWEQIVSLIYEPDTGIISLETTAFAPDDSQNIARIILEESSTLINRLSKISRDDTINQARAELDIAAARLKETRLEMSKFRDLEQIIDPTADFAGQMGVISALQQSLATAMIRRDLLVGTTTSNDQRMLQAQREIEAIEARIDDERTKVGARTANRDGDVLSRIVGEYEGLLVDREFAETSYLAALATYDGAVAEARRKSRYLAVHIDPTRAETAIYPRRLTLSLVATAFLMMAWALFSLTVYSIRDRR